MAFGFCRRSGCRGGVLFRREADGQEKQPPVLSALHSGGMFIPKRLAIPIRAVSFARARAVKTQQTSRPTRPTLPWDITAAILDFHAGCMRRASGMVGSFNERGHCAL